MTKGTLELLAPQVSGINSWRRARSAGQVTRLAARPWSAIFLAVCLCLTGCVERRLTIRTDPPGARVYIDDYEIGTAPCSTHFTYYGTRKIRLVKDGYQTKTFYQPIPPPWYQIPPFDFVTENLIPGTIRDHRTLAYQLEPELIVPEKELRRRAEAMREQVSREAGEHVVPANRLAPSSRESEPINPWAPPSFSAQPGWGNLSEPPLPGPAVYPNPSFPPPNPMLPAEAQGNYLGG